MHALDTDDLIQDSNVDSYAESPGPVSLKELGLNEKVTAGTGSTSEYSHTLSTKAKPPEYPDKRVAEAHKTAVANEDKVNAALVRAKLAEAQHLASHDPRIRVGLGTKQIAGVGEITTVDTMTYNTPEEAAQADAKKAS